MLPQLIVGWTFCAIVLIAALLRPAPARLFLGGFFILMGLGINLVLVFANPHLFVAIGERSLFPIYRDIFAYTVAGAPALWGAFVALYEAVAGLLMLQRNPRAKIGFLMGAFFCVMIAPLQWWSVPNLLLAAAMLYLSRREYAWSPFDRRVQG